MSRAPVTLLPIYHSQPIPDRVYWAPLADNFYSAEGVGMGNDFYAAWYSRRAEFPKGEGGAPALEHIEYEFVVYKTAKTANSEGDLYEMITGRRSEVLDAADARESRPHKRHLRENP